MPALRLLARAAAPALAAPLALLALSAALAAQTPADGPPAASGGAAERLGLTAGVSGGLRDTLGLLVVAVERDGPADRAGITEGSRLAEVNGVSLRLSPADLTDRDGGAGVVRRLDHALWEVRPGAGVVLRLAGFGAGRVVTVITPGAPAAAPVAAPPAVVAPSVVAPAAAPVEAPASAPAATVSPAAAPPDPPSPPAARPTLAGVVEAIGDVQIQLHQLARDEPALADTLASVADDLAALRRRIRLARGAVAAPATPKAAAVGPRADTAVAPTTTAAPVRLRVREDQGERAEAGAASAALPGLRVAPVSDDLARYFGPGSERGLLVVQADSTWDPIRAGDVLVRVDGAPADVARLRAAFSGRQKSTVEFLRRGRVLTLTFGEGGPR